MDDMCLLNERLRELSNWISSLENESLWKSFQSGKESLVRFKNYRISEKLTKLEEKTQIEAALTKMHKDAWSNGNPTEPVEECIEGLNSDWTWLEYMEEEYEENLLNAVDRLRRIECLLPIFLKKRARLFECVSCKGSVNLVEQCKPQELQILRKKYHLLLSEIASYENEFKEINSMAKELFSLKCFDIEEENKVGQEIVNFCSKEREKIENRISSIKEMEGRLNNLDELHAQFAREAKKFEYWLDTLQDEVSIVKPSEILDSRGHLFSLNMDRSKMGEKLETIHKLSEKIHTLGNLSNSYRPENPYTSLTYMNLFTRREGIENEIERQLKILQNVEEENKLKQEKMLAKAEGLEFLIDYHLKVVDRKVFNLQDRLETLKELRKKMNRYVGEYREIENLYFEMEPAHLMRKALDRCQMMKACMAKENPVHQMKILRKGWESLMTSVVKNTILTEHMIQIRDFAGMTDEEVLKHHKSFEEYLRNQKEEMDRHNNELFEEKLAEAIAEKDQFYDDTN